MRALGRPSREGWLAASIVAVVAAWHVAVGAAAGLGDAEALYFAYGLRPAGGYLDHPPMIGWLVGLSTSLAGDGDGAVRLVPALLHVLSTACCYLLARDCFGSPRAGLCAVVAMTLVPMVTVGGIAAAPDAPASASWLLFAVVLGRALRAHRERPGGLRGWELAARSALAGLLLGTTFLSKYTGLLLVPAALVALAHREHRALLRGAGPWVAALVAAAVVSPVVAWNAEHGFVSVAHRFVWTQSGAGPSLTRLGAAVGGQLLYLGPPMALALAWAAVRLHRERRDPERWLLWALAVPATGFTLALCAVSPAAEPHWTAQGLLVLVVALGGLAPGTRGWTRGRRVVAWSAGGLLAAVLVALHLTVFTPLLPVALGPDGYEPRYDLTNELHGWREVGRAVAAARGPSEPVAGSHYTICSQLVLALAREEGRGRARVLCLSDEVDDFDLWGDGSADGAASVLYVEDDRFGRPAAEVLPGRRLEQVGLVAIERGGVVVRTFRLVRALAPEAGRADSAPDGAPPPRPAAASGAT